MNKHVHIIGGGIIGLCTAYYLVESGFNVTIVDQGDFTDGTSFGNAGMIVPSHFVPMASPGMISQGLKWMFDSKSPFYVKPRLNLELMQWLWQFYKSSNKNHVENVQETLFAFNEKSKNLYKEISKIDGFDFAFEEKGLLMLYKTHKQAEEEIEMAETANKLGVKAHVLDKSELINLEPSLELDVLGGVHFPGDAHMYPNLFIKNMVAHLKSKDVAFLTNATVVDFKISNGKVNSIELKNGQKITVDQVVLSSGSWTAQLLKKIGVQMLLQGGKGYSLTLNNLKQRPNIPTILTESKVAVTPMGNDLRIGGTLELGALSVKINQRRVQGIIESMPKYYPGLKLPDINKVKIWKGFRPCTPDGMPYIGKVNNLSNLVVGTGHGMMGLSLGAATGKLLTEIISDSKPFLDLDVFNLSRF